MDDAPDDLDVELIGDLSDGAIDALVALLIEAAERQEASA